jgi:cyclic pyranopterin phosphate synthase
LGPVSKRATVKPTHIAPDGSIKMVDISAKDVTERSATAQALVRLSDAARTALQNATLSKGDAFVAAQIAGIMASKQVATLIPLAHQLPLSSVDVRFEWRDDGALSIEADARAVARTGAELEAMVAVSLAALTIYDMAKALDKGITIESVRLLAKRGGKSGPFDRAAARRAQGAKA